MVVTDHNNQLVCPHCKQPVYSDVHGVNKGKDEKGTYVVCSLCGNKIYLSKER